MEKRIRVTSVGLYCHHTARFTHNTGIQRCVRSIARALIEAGECLTPLVWDAVAGALAPAGSVALEHLARWNGPEPGCWHDQLPGSGGWLLLVELISGPYQPDLKWLQAWSSLRGWRTAAVFHDAIPLGWGGTASEFHVTYMRGLAQLDLVLATSEHVANVLRLFWQREGINPQARLQVMPLAAEIAGVPRRLPTEKVSSWSASKPLRLLQVGSLEPRKNHKAVLKALAWIESNFPGAIELHWLGWGNNEKVVSTLKRAQACGLPVHWCGHVSDDVLIQQFAAAECSVYPSLDEGFGLPVLESLWLGTPSICTDVPALEGSGKHTGCLVMRSSSWWSLAQAFYALKHQPQLITRLRLELNVRSLRRWSDVAADWKLQTQSFLSGLNQE